MSNEGRAERREKRPWRWEINSLYPFDMTPIPRPLCKASVHQSKDDKKLIAMHPRGFKKKKRLVYIHALFLKQRACVTHGVPANTHTHEKGVFFQTC